MRCLLFGSRLLTGKLFRSEVGRKQSIFGVNWAWNIYDKKRVAEVGPDVAAAEWILRCGGSIRWQGRGSYSKDYNSLPSGTTWHIEAIDGSNSCIDDNGFQHLNGLKHCKEVKLVKCYYVYDEAMKHLSLIKDTLEVLEVADCSSVTEEGIQHLSNLTNLKTLKLVDLMGVKNFETCVKNLQSSLQNCKIVAEKAP